MVVDASLLHSFENGGKSKVALFTGLPYVDVLDKASYSIWICLAYLLLKC